MSNAIPIKSAADCAVVIACRDQGHFLRECLDSILAQTTPPREIIIVNDGSICQETQKILASDEVTSVARILANAKPAGLAAARNQGINIVTTTYILPLDADDKIAPGYIEKATGVLAASPNTGIVGGDSQFFGKRSGKAPFPVFSKWRMTVDNCILAASVFRKSDWSRIGGYFEGFREGFEDWDFNISLLEAGFEYHHLNETVHYYRRHDDNMTDRLDRNPGRKEELFAELVSRHAEFFRQHAGEAAHFLLYQERTRQRAFGKIPLIVFCRKLMRMCDVLRMIRMTTNRFKGNGFAVLTILTVLVITFQVYFSVFRNASIPTRSVDIQLTYEPYDAHKPFEDSCIIFGLTSDGRRLPLAFFNLSQSGEMTLMIRPLGKSRETALGGEIWLLSRDGFGDGLFPHVEGESAGWHLNTEVWRIPALVSTGGERPLKFSLQNEKQTIFFIRHPWSGRCEIDIGGLKSEFDLYDASQNSILPVLLLNNKMDIGSMPRSMKLNLQLPEDTIVEIGLVKSNSSKWIVSQIADGQGRKLEKSKNADAYVPTAGIRFQNYGLLAVSAGLLIFLARCSVSMEQVSRKLYYLYAILLAVTVTSFFVMVFYPGVLTPDSFAQWVQAKSGHYNDWHPIGFTIVMAMCQKCLYFCAENTQVAMIAWLAGVFFWFSCYTLAGSLLKNVKLALLSSVIITLYYPFWPYTVTLWKDVLFTAGFLYFAAYILCFARHSNKVPGFKYFIILLFINLIMLLNRHTAWAVLLACLPGLVILMPRRMHLRSSVIFIMALIAAIALNKALYSVKNVSKSGNLSNMFLSYDLVGTLHFSKADLNEISKLKTASAFGMENMLEAINRYEPGNNMNYLIFGEKAPFQLDMLLASNCASQDLLDVAMRHPLSLFQHKLGIQKVLWDRKTDGGIWYAYQTVTDKWEGYDIFENSKIPEINAVLRRWLAAAASSPGSIWQLFLRHILIFSGMLCTIIVAIVTAWLRKSDGEFVRALCFLAWAALSCWLPNAVVLPGADWRYLLPTTSIGVIIIVCTICRIVGRQWQQEAVS